MLQPKALAVVNQVRQVILGKDTVICKVLMAILAKGHILLEDNPGVGKTTLALAFSKAMSLRYNRVQFTPEIMPADVVGFSIWDQATGEFVYRPGAALCNLFLADEINRTSAKTQSSLLEAMEEGQVTVDGISHPSPQPFTVIATQNPVGSAGTQPFARIPAGSVYDAPFHRLPFSGSGSADPQTDGRSPSCRPGPIGGHLGRGSDHAGGSCFGPCVG